MANVLLSSALLFSRWIDAPVPYVIAARCVVASAALFLFLKISRSSFSGFAKTGQLTLDLWMLVASGILLAAHWITFFYSGRLSTIALAVVAMHTYPLMTSLIEPWLEESVEWKEYSLDIVLALLATAGIAYMGLSVAALEREGLFWGLAAAALITARNLVVRRKLSHWPSSQIMLGQISVAGLLLSPALIFYTVQQNFRPGLNDLILIVILGVLITAIAHTMLTRAVVKMSARTTGVIASVQPLYSALAAFLFFDEIPSVATFLGGGVVLMAAMVESYRYHQRSSA